MSNARNKFVIGGVVILVAIIYLIITSTQASIEYFLTVDELLEKKQDLQGKSLRISGAVVGDTIAYDADGLILYFDIAHIPGDNKEIEAKGGLSQVLHEAVLNPSRARIKVTYSGVKPDLLQNEAQAIITGKYGDDEIFYADELLLKCPTKYEDALPEQAIGDE